MLEENLAKIAGGIMNILHVYKTYFPDSYGGVEQFIKTLSKQTAQLNCHNTLLTLSKYTAQSSVTDPELKVIQYPINLDVRSCPMGYQFLQKFTEHANQADIIHYHFPWPFADLVHLLKKIRKPSIVTYHSDIVRQRLLKIIYRPVMQRFLQSVDYIAPTSNNYLDSSDVLSKYQQKCHVIPIGIDEADYSHFDQQKLLSWIKKMPPNFLLFVGVLRYYKGLHTLLTAAKGTTIPIVIAGTGPYEQQLKKQATDLNLTNVHFLGYISDDDKAALLSLARAVVFPSHLRSEAFGITLVEGLMFGKPLISCEIGTGTSFINKHEVTGYVIPPEDPSKLQEAMLKLYNDADLAVGMGKAARLRYETEFTAMLMGKRYAEIYTKLMEKSA